MIFQEKKIENGYLYEVEDIFGTITIETDEKLTDRYAYDEKEKLEGQYGYKELLDDMVALLLKGNSSSEIIKGEIKHEKGIVKYTFKRSPTWSEDDEEEKKQCENLPILTKKPGKGFIQIVKSKIPTWNWLKRFVAAFREAWKKSK